MHAQDRDSPVTPGPACGQAGSPALTQPPVRALSRHASIIATPRAPSSTVGKSSASGSHGFPAILAAITSAASL